jgi:flagellar hook assembly protein FlgD
MYNVEFEIFDISGKLLHSKLCIMHYALKPQVRWDGRDNSGTRVSPGPYIIRLKNGNKTVSSKVLLAR